MHELSRFGGRGTLVNVTLLRKSLAKSSLEACFDVSKRSIPVFRCSLTTLAERECSLPINLIRRVMKKRSGFRLKSVQERSFLMEDDWRQGRAQRKSYEISRVHAFRSMLKHLRSSAPPHRGPPQLMSSGQKSWCPFRVVAHDPLKEGPGPDRL